MFKKSKSNFLGGPKVKSINAQLMVINCVLTLLVLYSCFTVKTRYKSIVYSMNDYSECNKAIFELRDTSNFLTEQVRLFTFTLETEYMQNYLYEKYDVRRQELSVDIVEMSHSDDAPDISLKMALNEAGYLQKREMYVLRLVCDAINLSEDFVPDVVKAVELTPGDKLLNEEAKLAKARAIVYSTEYLNSKDRIQFYTNNALSYLINDYIEDEHANDIAIHVHFAHQIFFIIALLVFNITLYIILLFLVLIPLFRNQESIQKNAKMPLKGAYEVRYIAAAYNAICDKNAVTTSALKHKAEHDPLTGLINRNAFDEIKRALINAPEPIAYLLVDIDFFKKINDKYGHVAGDTVLKKISEMLMEQFRATDYVARIGGDEFAIIMTKFGVAPEEIIQRKITELNKRLQNIEDGLPSVSLSVGVAFSETGYTPDLVEKADAALYSVKRGGRCNCSFYEEAK